MPEKPDNRESGMRSASDANEFCDSARLEVLGLLSAGVAHDLNNLLFVIKGTVEICRMNVSEGDPLRAKFDRIEEAVDRAERLTRMVLQNAPPSDRGYAPIQLQPLVKVCLKMITAGLPSAVKIHQEIAPDAAAVPVDLMLAHRVVATLLSTAGDALLEEGGWLAVTLDSDEINAPTGSRIESSIAGPALIFTVAHGVGKHEDVRRQLKEHDGQRSITLSEVDGIPADLDDVVRSFGGSATCHLPTEGGRSFKVVFPVAEIPAVL